MIYESKIRSKIEAKLLPSHLQILNESPSHGLPASAEKHFRVVVVSPVFVGQMRIDRHRLVHDIVADELREHIHALSVQAFTPEEWAKRGGIVAESPACLGGGKRERGE